VIAFLVGLVIIAMAHVVACAVDTAEAHHSPAAAAAQIAAPPSLEAVEAQADWLGETAVHGHDLGGAGDCCGSVDCLYAAPVRTGPLSLPILLLCLAALGWGVRCAPSARPDATLCPCAPPPPRTGTGLLQLACVSRT
jgi:hypothetical protein